MKDSSSSSSINTQTLEIQATFKTKQSSEETVQLLAKSRRNQEENMQISIKKKTKKKEQTLFKISYYCSDETLQVVYAVLLKMTTKNQGGKKYNQTKDLKCATRLLSEKFEKMGEPKKVIVRS
ncbi:hypothetical protein Ahy_B05g076796 [Arachis hypogaea]|uniref:Uncharacterized protein n=1 Tax=Arachis hypogaea TaxID=3818 RepID=A0A444Z490_ARAHY|nr:hypothetical protein Ahy_B05g076796 [Arachis hypogaea]